MIPFTAQRVPMHAAEPGDERLCRRMRHDLARYAAAGPEAIDRHLAELDHEWNIERTLEAHAATASLVGLILSVIVDPIWLLLPALVAGFLLQHAMQGQCPPLAVFRRLGFRTQSEIDVERYVLKALRGDFQGRSSVHEEDSCTDSHQAFHAVRH